MVVVVVLVKVVAVCVLVVVMVVAVVVVRPRLLLSVLKVVAAGVTFVKQQVLESLKSRLAQNKCSWPQQYKTVVLRIQTIGPQKQNPA